MPSPADLASPPAHGFRGDPIPRSIARPQGICLAISREAGARGGTIARKVGELLDWQVYDQETLDYLIHNDSSREQLVSDLPPTSLDWMNGQFNRLERDQNRMCEPDLAGMVRLLLAIAARGEAVIVGRGAGYLLPQDTTLHVRVISPLDSRVAYFAEWLRLNRDEAIAEVRSRDEQRSNFLGRILNRNPADALAYDLVVNSERLGIEAAAQCISWAIRMKQMFPEFEDSKDSFQLSDLPRT